MQLGTCRLSVRTLRILAYGISRSELTFSGIAIMRGKKDRPFESLKFIHRLLQRERGRKRRVEEDHGVVLAEKENLRGVFCTDHRPLNPKKTMRRYFSYFNFPSCH